MDIPFVFGKITTIRLPNKDSPSVFSNSPINPTKQKPVEFLMNSTGFTY